jgi:F0F1-type ATP synthase delta subunit
MATISIKNLSKAIYESSYNKEGIELDKTIEKAVELISRKHLMGKSKEIIKELEKIIDKEEKIIRAKVSSKNKINDKSISEIENFIKKKYKTENTIVEYQIDKELLGGIKIEVGDEIIDTTLKNLSLTLINKLNGALHLIALMQLSIHQ